MEITWFGHACFQINTASTTIVTDPFDDSLGLPVPQLNANIVTVSHDNPRHNAIQTIDGSPKLFNHAGEYEMQQVFIVGAAIYPPTVKSNVNALKNVVFTFETENLTICHMGDIRHVPTQRQVEHFANVDILLVPVGDGNSLNASQASEVIGLIEPSIVIPMHYHLPNITIELNPLEKFIKEMGLPDSAPIDKLKISKSTLPENTQTIILSPQI